MESAAGLDEEATADLSRSGFLAAVTGDAAFQDRLVPGPGLRAWVTKVATVLRSCWLPLLLAALVCAMLTQLLPGRPAFAIVAAPVLVDVAGGVGLLLLLLVWACWLAGASMPIVVCLTVVVGIVTGWGGTGRLPGPRRTYRLVGHRFGVTWGWLAAIGAVSRALPLIITSDSGSRLSAGLSVLLAVASAGLATLMGVLGCVVLFERGRSLRRAQQLLSLASGRTVLALGLTSAGMTVLPWLTAPAGEPATAAVTGVCVLLWAVAALVTYAQARRVEGAVTSVSLGREAAL